MMSSRIKLLRPVLLNNKAISSWFTLRNHAQVNINEEIAGLNLGLNTSTNAETIRLNRNALFKMLDLDENKVAYGIQVHDTHIEKVHDGGIYPGTDGFVTSKSGVVLAIQVADCAAVLFGDIVNGVIGAAHAGWRGASGNIINKTVKKMKESGAEVNHIKTYISPCISLKNFEVGEEVATQFPSRYVDNISFKKPHVDLKAFIKDQLIAEGIADQNIELDKQCTIEDEDFYSYRRQKDKSGRMMALITLN